MSDLDCEGYDFAGAIADEVTDRLLEKLLALLAAIAGFLLIAGWAND